MAPQRETEGKKGSGHCVRYLILSSLPMEAGTPLPQPLVHLPPNVLHLIFRDSVGHSNFTLSKSLLPHTLNVMYRQALLQNVFKIGEFCASLVQRPELARAVHSVVLANDPNDGKEEWMWWTMTTAGKGRLEELLSCKQDGAGAFLDLSSSPARLTKPPAVIPYDPLHFQDEVGVGLVQDLLAFLPYLSTVTLDGHYVLLTILDPDYLVTDPIPPLRVLCTFPADEEDYEDDGRFFHSISTFLPSLHRVAIGGCGQAGALPVDGMNISPEIHVASRSSDLEVLELRRMIFVDSEFRTMAAAFSSLSKLHVIALDL